MNRFVITVTIVSVAVAICGARGFYIYKEWKSRIPPKKWRKIGEVLKLYTYPLKSGRFIDLEKVECTTFGFSLPKCGDLFQLRDRSFIIYDEVDLVGKSARIYPTMVLITISSQDHKHIILQAPEMDTLQVEVPIKSRKNIKIIRFQSSTDEYVPTLDCGDEASKWLSKYLGRKDSGLRLGYHDNSALRKLTPFTPEEDYKFYKYLSNSVFGLYSDLAAALLLNEKSLINLNEKLDKKVTRTTFRPNIVVDGPEIEAFDEDDWFWLKIGDVVVRNFKDCTRCIMTTVDPETGLRNKSMEPLKTLSKYRISKGPSKGPIMGVNLEVLIPGVVNVGDDVLVGIMEE